MLGVLEIFSRDLSTLPMYSVVQYLEPVLYSALKVVLAARVVALCRSVSKVQLVYRNTVAWCTQAWGTSQMLATVVTDDATPVVVNGQVCLILHSLC